MKNKDTLKNRDPNWKWLRALGHKKVRDKTIYMRKIKHKGKDDVSDTKENL